ncbi:aminotransferase [Scheffersomyces xylosifermentans]|uniref:aminotransferase n=1 Tax=Scheffersomyces xylosifermentans TaxID=1304137 RepID=UPI00315DE06C
MDKIWSSDDILESGLLHRSLKVAPYMAKNASGSYIYLQDGTEILDGCGGAAVISVGHSNPEVIEAVTEQLKTITYVHTAEYTTAVSEELANLLLESYKGKVAKVYFVNSGSEANEAAIKMSLQYFYEQGKTEKTHFISRKQSYHGNCLGGMSLSGHVVRREPFEGIISSNFHQVSPANEYRFKNSGESTADYVKRLASELEEEILKIGPEKVACFFAETIVGATTACLPAPEGYFKAIQAVCQKYDVLLALDEIMCGSGRTGTFFAWEAEGIVPDITTAGKALSGGYSPLSAVFLAQKFVDVLGAGSNSFNCGHTYQSFALSSAAGLSVQKIIRRDGFLQNVVEMGKYLEYSLKQALSSSKVVGNIRGRGLFWGIEFVSSRATKHPIGATIHFGYMVQRAIFEEGVAVYPGFGTVDGHSGDHILIAPPFNVTKQQIDRIVAATSKGISKIESSLFSVTNGDSTDS